MSPNETAHKCITQMIDATIHPSFLPIIMGMILRGEQIYALFNAIKHAN
jgi:hypothetical protein